MSAISQVSSAHRHHAAAKTSLLAKGAAGTKAAPPAASKGAGAAIAAPGIAKLEKAVTDALQSVKDSGQTDPNQAIQSALTKIFKSDPSTDQDDSTNATDSAATAGQSFKDILKSFGVTEGQFQTDVKAALQKAGATGKIDPATLFKSFATGSTIDAVG